jgi:hypothetical protein
MNVPMQIYDVIESEVRENAEFKRIASKSLLALAATFED